MGVRDENRKPVSLSDAEKLALALHAAKCSVCEKGSGCGFRPTEQMWGAESRLILLSDARKLAALVGGDVDTAMRVVEFFQKR